MCPRELTEQEKNIQRERLYEKGRELLFSYGIKKTSVEDITKASGMAKGSFYHYFQSKEELFFDIILQYHNQWFEDAGRLLTQESEVPLKLRVKQLIKSVFQSDDFLFFFKYHREVEEMIAKVSPENLSSIMSFEHEAYAKLITMCGLDTDVVKPGVIHNYLHVIYFGMSNKDMLEQDIHDETLEALLNGLILYIFGGTQ